MPAAKWTSGLILLALAVIFALGLTYASIELPAQLHRILEKTVPALEGDSHTDEDAIFRTDLFIAHYRLRTVGAVCLGLLLLLIAAGFITGRKSLASTGALVLLLPVFAQFATVMFFLAGLGVLNVIWLPVLDISFDVGRLGDVVYLPYRLLTYLFSLVDLDIHNPLVYALIGSGLLLFILGTFAWMTARQRKQDMADFWVYRISRHPQYLGWIVWSYGMLLSLIRVRYPKRSWGIAAALPWLLSSMIIVGVAMLEERHMTRLLGERYETYRQRTPFLFPLPRWISGVLSTPVRLLFRKKFPERKGEIAVNVILFTILLVGLSPLTRQWTQPSGIPSTVDVRPGEIRAERLIKELYKTDSRRIRYRIVMNLADMGVPAVEPLIGLLENPDPEIREFAASALGKIGSERAVEPLIRCLEDKSENVSMNAIHALGEIGDAQAVDPILDRLTNEIASFRRAAASALGKIGSEEVIDPLIGLLDDPDMWVRRATVISLGVIGSERAANVLARKFESEEIRVRRAIVVALLRIGSPRSLDILTKATQDEDWEVRLYATEAIKRIKVLDC